MPELAILSPLPPYPPLAGGTAHIIRAIRQLARFYAIHLDALAPDPATVTWGPLAVTCQATHVFQPQRRAGIGIAPPAVRLEYSPALVEHLNQTWTKHPPNIVQLEFTTMAQYAPLARRTGALVVCTAHNVAFLAQVRRARLQRGIGLKLRRWIGAFSLWLYEVRALRSCHLVVTLGQTDRDVLQRWLPGVQVVCVPSGIDIQEWPVCFNPEAVDEVLFVGNYLHPPNVEGALWLAQQVWPRVRRARPSARLTLAGRAPPSAIRDVASADIRVPGTVPDLRPLYAQAGVFVAPIFWGSGIRIKLLEALACGLPVVTTAPAAEGLDLVRGQSALFAEKPGDFADAIVRLLDDRDLRVRMSAAGRALVERKYDWNCLGAHLADLYEQARSRLKG